ncbi:PREDICTED: ral guanine nucleotide dissociation stimulator-like [Chinchilla lanigera]|uniref:ral guanine nucleotide dissociation stimulator-like n=1 Tax=Chinchilla lanigera TaxID=34839 RepID=UPI00038EAA50|nr:PREDICTED: ral guanine nucleotide dissociation stimulator-like [Chinchilla lanigera]XP_005375838.1 PREDICTED: ral guanine nucleotide dissociation stimulator-like [Chinchilla lanigera]
MWSCCRTNSPGSGHKREWSGGLVQIQTHWDTCRPLSLRRINTRIPSVTRKSPGQGANEFAPRLEEARRAGSLEPGTLKKLVNQLVPAHRRGDPFFVPAFLSTYRRFATTRQVLDLLFLRYRFFHPDSEEDQQNKSALSSLLETWLLQYPGDFCHCPDLASLKQLVAYALVNLPDSQIIPQVCGLLSRPGAH